MTMRDDANLVAECVPSRVSHISVAVVPDHVFEAAVRLATAYIEAGRVEGGGCPRCGCELLETLIKSRRFACGVVDHGPQHDGGQYVTEATCGCLRNQIANLTARLATVSADLAEHKRRLLEQSAVLNSVRKERDESRQILCHVPGRIAIKAKEDAGYGVAILPMEHGE